MSFVLLPILPFVVSTALHAQMEGPPWAFEAASVKRSPPRVVGGPQGRVGCFGGPVSRDPIRFTCSKASISLMVLYAYDLKAYQIRPPASEDDDRFEVAAVVPTGATAAQVKPMLQNLLADRFKLAFHYDKAEIQGYSIAIAKSGLKMKESVPKPWAAPENVGRRVKDADGFEYLSMSNGFVVSYSSGLTRWIGNDVPVDADAAAVRLTGLLSALTGAPVVDTTDLKGKYDFTLTFSSDSVGGQRWSSTSSSDETDIVPPGPGGLTLFGALVQQLGLKLEPKKIPVDVFVIDRAEKSPIEN
jgi:uncharacterized protein (TIGR03435 family)